MKIAVIALGKIGLPLAVQFAEVGHEVVGVDVQQSVVDSVNAAIEPFPGEAFLQDKLSTLVPAGSPRTALTGSTTVTGTRPVTTTGVAGTAGLTTTRTTTSTTAATASSLLASPTPRPGASSTVTATAGAGTGSGTSTGTGASTYTVAEGDTIITIALAHNLDWQELLALNNLQPDSLIQVGQEIRLR